MTLVTENLHPEAPGLDARTPVEILSALLRGQKQALESVGHVLPALGLGAQLIVDALNGGKRLIYAGAGSSALAALADGVELPGTFGIDASRVRVLMAGGVPQDANMPGVTEDSLAQARADALEIAPGDAVIAISASGSTPYTLELASLARRTGARVIAIANNEGAEIFSYAEVAVYLPTAPEVIAGSTRLGAATAQKAALNLMSTLTGVLLGHVHDGMMVNVVADNAKLIRRASDMVERISGCDADCAERALTTAEGNVKAAVLVAAADLSNPEAEAVLAEAGGRLRQALDGLNASEKSKT